MYFYSLPFFFLTSLSYSSQHRTVSVQDVKKGVGLGGGSFSLSLPPSLSWFLIPPPPPFRSIPRLKFQIGENLSVE